ncbi:conserved hypothetical protein [Verticillium alfalfae VaMs.102]|uniref:Extracelular serine carboxypeptidase n=1 Tax=Verticillium alfalfae (strain VaMs.102 / ATCC MYA-4576 / FGSC 10136) TaxID=526221 RepID=C9SNM6_VERA1|nr:conserved hypothetical protein [Verticillium alfalfae VaMs.102]EEY20391.1 conserved hypothetical protein [Verticillium alfalfae VaMs.102]
MRPLLVIALPVIFATAPSAATFILGTEHVSLTSQPRITLKDDTVLGPFNLSVPVDHFHNETRYEPHSNGTFPLRYWINKKHYRPGGPVFLLASGETTGEDRLGYLDHGIIAMFAEATHGLGLVLEHRYYGTSFPVANVSIPNLRFLSTEQALADTAFFAEHVTFPDLEHEELGPTDVPWIAFGGSYAGAFAAFLRKLYPDVFWGAVSSSGVTQAIVDYWEYYEAARRYAPADCADVTATLTEIAGCQKCLPRRDVKKCFAVRGNERWQRVDLDQGMERSWFWQVCTEWGYFQTGSGAPADQKPLVSRLIDLNYTSLPCREAFNITTLPDVERINKHGGFGFSYPRVAIVDGEADPWRAATPHRIGLPERQSTTEEPFLLMGGGAVHHWDENGISGKDAREGYGESLPPSEVKRVQEAELAFVKTWVEAWSEAKTAKEDESFSLEL